MTLLFSLVALAVTAPDLQGVPYGDSIVSLINHPTTSEGLWLVQPGGAERQVTGLRSAGAVGTGINAVQLDPIDDRVWIGGINSTGNGDTSGQLNWVKIAANGTIAQFSQHGRTGIQQSISAITFDDNGNPVVTSSRANVGGGVFRIDRATGAATRIASIANGLHNAIARDPQGNVYVGISDSALGAGGGEIYRLTKNPDCTYQAPTLLGTLADPRVSGVTWARDPLGGANDVLVLTTFGPMFEFPLAGGSPRTLNVITQLNAVRLDRRLGQFLVVDDGGTASEVYRVTRDYAAVALHSRLLGGAAGATTGIDINDEPFGAMRVVPMCPARDVPVDIEMGVSCAPGQLAVLHIMAPIAVPVAIATAPASGRVFASIRGLIVPTGLAPGSVVLQAACYDPLTGALSIGSPIAWPAN